LPIFSLLFFINSKRDTAVLNKPLSTISFKHAQGVATLSQTDLSKCNNNKHKKTARTKALDNSQDINIADNGRQRHKINYFTQTDFSGCSNHVCKLHFSRVKLRGPPSFYGA
jgi:hypothetical protein